MYINRRLDMYLKSIRIIRQRSPLRCTEAMRFGRACKARVLHLSGVGGHLENAKIQLKMSAFQNSKRRMENTKA